MDNKLIQILINLCIAHYLITEWTIGEQGEFRKSELISNCKYEYGAKKKQSFPWIAWLLQAVLLSCISDWKISTIAIT